MLNSVPIFRRSLVAVFAAIFSAPHAEAQHDGLPDALTRSVAAAIRSEVERQDIVGLSAAIGVGGELVWSEGVGVADLENQVPASANTVYRLASISKPVTAIAIMQLVESGKVDLDASVGTYVADWPKKRWPVTVRRLLCHQGGVRHYAPKDLRKNTRAYRTVTDALEYFKDDPLLFEPGARYSYTTFGYNLLGAVVESVSGASFVEYLNGQVFPKAGTKAMQDDAHARIIPHRARGYARTPARSRAGDNGEENGAENGPTLRNAMLVDISYKVPGGGLCSTAADLVRFGHAVHSGVLVTATTRDTMWTPQTTADGEATKYGLGWRIDETEGRRTVGHSGSQAGTKTQLVILPDDQVIVAVMCNSEWANPGRIARRVAVLVAVARGR